MNFTNIDLKLKNYLPYYNMNYKNKYLKYKKKYLILKNKHLNLQDMDGGMNTVAGVNVDGKNVGMSVNVDGKNVGMSADERNYNGNMDICVEFMTEISSYISKINQNKISISDLAETIDTNKYSLEIILDTYKYMIEEDEFYDKEKAETNVENINRDTITYYIINKYITDKLRRIIPTDIKIITDTGSVSANNCDFQIVTTSTQSYNNNLFKLTDEDVRAIQKLCEEITQIELAKSQTLNSKHTSNDGSTIIEQKNSSQPSNLELIQTKKDQLISILQKIYLIHP